MVSQRDRYTYSLLAIFIFSLLLVACIGPDAEVGDTPSDVIDTNTSTESIPTHVSTPHPDLVVLLASSEANLSQVASLEVVVSELSGETGLNWERRLTLSSSELDSSILMVIALPPYSDFEALAAAAPAIQFLAVGIPGIEQAENVSVIGPLGMRHDHQGFIAGYLAAMITHDWRVGVISLGDTPAGQAELVGFINGAGYFCGQCRPAYPPFLEYPMYVGLSEEEVNASWRIASETMAEGSVRLVYVSPEVESEALLIDLTQRGMVLIGGEEPSEEMKPQWVATIRSDPGQAVRDLWEDLLAGKGGASLQMPLVIEDVNTEYLSPGRQRLLEDTMRDLLAGFIDTGVDPLTGETY
jgi:hypothetical protein